MEKLSLSNNTTFVCLSIDEQEAIIERAARKVLESWGKNTPANSKPKNYVYGIAGIRQLFSCCQLKAQQLKNGIIRDAVYQEKRGGKIIVDADLAMELYRKSMED